MAEILPCCVKSSKGMSSATQSELTNLISHPKWHCHWIKPKVKAPTFVQTVFFLCFHQHWWVGDSDSFKAEKEEAKEKKYPKIISFLYLQCFIPKGTCHIQVSSIKINKSINNSSSNNAVNITVG